MVNHAGPTTRPDPNDDPPDLAADRPTRTSTPRFQGRSLRPILLAISVAAGLLLAPAVSATTGQPLNPGQTGAIVVLLAGTIGLSVYLFFAMFQPEKF